MPNIIPFKAYRYNEEKVKNFNSVLTPPYDVISPSMQNDLYKKSPHNFVRIDLRKKSKSEKNLYTAANQEFLKWIKSGVILQESKDSIYVYTQEYKSLSGKKVKRYGFFSLMKINPKKVKKHENTLSGPKKDRTALMTTMKAQMSPIFGIFQEKKGTVHAILKGLSSKNALIDVKRDGIHHKMHVLSDAKKIERIQKAIEKENMYIADGHHRFEVAYQFNKKRGIKPSKKSPGTGYILTYLCDALRNDFTIYPTHRLLSNLDESWKEIFISQASRYFNSELFSTLPALKKALDKTKAGYVSFGVFDGKSYAKLTLKRKTKDLDTTVLNKYMVTKLLGEEVAGSDKIQFTRDEKGSIQQIKKKKSDILFFLSKMPITEMIRVSDEGVKLPQKSTYFYPKLLSGLMVYKY